MKHTSILNAAALFLSCFAVACGLKENTPHTSSIASVAIPQTDVRDQNKIGFCWAYAGIGLIESKLKSEQNLSFDFSEEALGFYRIIEELKLYTNAYQTDATTKFEEVEQAVLKASLQGWVVRRPKDFPLPDTFELMEKYGVIPESAWSVKFKSAEATDQMIAEIRADYLKLLKEKGRAGTITDEDYLQILGSPKAFGSVPPTSFEYNGEAIKAQDFVSNVAKFKASDYVLVEAQTSRDLPKIVSALKQTLAMGLSVPLGFGVTFALLKEGTFSYPVKNHEFYDKVATKRAASVFAKDGGHAVLITDFVNQGGREGAIAPEELAAEVAKPEDELLYIKVKNSWGLEAARNEGDVSIGGAKDGYYRLDLGYLRGEADSAVLSVVVPTKIAESLK